MSIANGRTDSNLCSDVLSARHGDYTLLAGKGRCRRGTMRYVQLYRQGNELLLRFEPPYEITLGLPPRIKESRRRALRVLKQTETLSQDDSGRVVVARFNLSQERNAQRAAAEIDRRLTAFAEQRISAKAVEDVLRITSKERIRWTKDGRLPKSDASYQFPVDKIADLLARPRTISEWRSADDVGSKR